MIFQFIAEHTEYPVAKWVEFLNVSRSGYYKWLDQRERRYQEAEEYERQVVKAFRDGRSTYGVDRICGVLRTKGYTASYYKVKRIMEKNGLESLHNRRRQRSLTDSSASKGKDLQNLVRGIEITEPFQVLSSDISYVRTQEGFEYLCQIRDVASGVELASTMADHMRAELVTDTIEKMLIRFDIPEGCIFHSDRGSQYTAEATVQLLNSSGILQSFSRVGKPGDNSWSESFYANLKKECVHWRSFETRQEAREEVFYYIEAFYNTRRVQKRLGYISPIEWLKQRLAEYSRRVA